MNVETLSPPETKVKYPAKLARSVGDGLVALLKPYCEPGFIEIAGSLRRGKAEVGDVEIVYVSRFGPLQKQGEMFESTACLADEFINHLLFGKLRARLSMDGKMTWGEWNKLAVHRATGVPVDLFRTTKEDWARSLVIRTGPKELNIRLIMAAKDRGLNLHAYGNGFTRAGTGEVVSCGSEKELFELCGVKWIEPEER